LTYFDYAVIAIVGLSVVVSMMRGAVKEMLAILGWIAAFYVAKAYSPLLATFLPEGIPTEALKTLIAFVILLIAVLFLNGLITMAISGVISKVGLGWINRFLGMLFGFAKGLLISCVLVLLAGLTSLPKEQMWTDAVLSEPLEMLVKSALPWLPESVSKHAKFD
jgi:membrane protein required for colicin V production|tara:strand:+ start:684 stop:1175 length:492 start_codon:yes stop_codon:yes gene_type:complete